MPSLKALGGSLIDRISPALVRHGFKFVKARQSWRKREASATCAFHLAFIHHPADFDVTADVAVRLEALAKLLEDLLGGADAAAAVVGRFTVGVELGNLTIGRQRRWTVATAEDVDQVAASLVEAFETIAQPYFRQYSDPERLLAVLSSDSPDSWIHAPFHHTRAIRAVALAFLLGRHGDFARLVERKRAFLLESKDPNAQRNLPVFEKVVEQLRGRWRPATPRSDLAE